MEFLLSNVDDDRYKLCVKHTGKVERALRRAFNRFFVRHGGSRSAGDRMLFLLQEARREAPVPNPVLQNEGPV
jgi:hypothetical protein